MTLAFDLLRVLAMCSSVVLYVSPWPEFRRIHRRRSSGRVSPLPVVLLFCNAYLWCVYGCVVDSIFPLVVVNAFGVLTSLVFSAVFFRWSSAPQRHYARQLWLGFGSVVLLVTIYAVVQTRRGVEVAASLGVVCVTANLCLFASPLETMGHVLRSKSAASLPIALCVANLVSGALWSTMALAQRDLFVLAPNALGTMLSVVQVALYLAYPPTETETEVVVLRPLPVITSASKPDELSIKVAMQGPVFLETSSLTPLVRGEVRPLLVGSYGSQSVKVAAA